MNLSRLPRITPVGFEVNARTVRHGHPEWGRVGGRMTAGERNKRNSTRSVSPSALSNPLCGFTFTFARTRPSARLPSIGPRYRDSFTVRFYLRRLRVIVIVVFFLFFVGQQQSTPLLQHPVALLRPAEIERSENARAPLIIWTEYAAESDRP